MPRRQRPRKLTVPSGDSAGSPRTVRTRFAWGKTLPGRILEALPVGIVRISRDGSIQQVNRQARAILGLRKKDLVNPSVLDYRNSVYREDGSPWPIEEWMVWTSLKTGTSHSGRLMGLRRPDGKVLWLLFALVPVFEGPSGAVDGVVLTLMDVSERRRGEAALRELATRMRGLFDGARDAILVADAGSGLIVDANAQAAKLLNRPKHQIIGMHQSRLHPPECAKEYRDLFVQHARTDGGFTIDGEIVRSDGQRVPVEINASALRLPDGRTLLQGIFRDVTERRRTEAERARHAAQLKSLAEASTVINSSATIAGVASVAERQAGKILDADAAALRFCDAGVNPPAALRRGTPSLRTWTRLAGRLCDGVHEANAPLRMTRKELAARKWASHRPRGAAPARSWVGAPVRGADERAIGVLHLWSRRGQDFSESDEALVVQLAQMASVAIENLRLLEAVEQGRQEMQGLSRRLFEVQESERRHLARELHDEIGQLLTGLKMTLDVAVSTSGRREAPLRRGSEIVRTLIHRVRALSVDLRPSMLDDLGLVPTLLWHCQRFGEQTRIRLRLRHRGVQNRRFGQPVETAVYRIVQEALTNVARHAGIARAEVRLSASARAFKVVVEDRGTGFDAGTVGHSAPSAGLSGMRERASLLGGSVEIDSLPGRGTRVSASLPLPAR